MTLPVWPATLPELRGLVSAAGSDALFDALSRTQMDDGPGRVRRRTYFLSTVKRMALWLKFANTYPVFIAFVRDDLNTGARRFLAPVLMPNGIIAQKTCRIEGEIREEFPASTFPGVSFPLRIWDYTA